jgi:elongation factor P hydroxylase
MADRVSASIRIGGTLSAALFAELSEIIAQEDLSTEWDGEAFAPDHIEAGKPLDLFAHQVAGGAFQTLEPFCVANGIPFARRCDAFVGQWGPERVVFTGAGVPTSFDAGEDERILVDRATCLRLGSIDAVISHFDAADFAIPPLVVGDDSAPAA